MVPDETLMQSAKILCDIAKDEYKNEFNRCNTLDTKIGISLPIVASYFFIVLQLNSIKKLFSREVVTVNVFSFLYSILEPISYSMSVLLAALSVYLLFCAIVTRKYEIIDLALFNERKYLDDKPEKNSAILITVYIRATNYNTAINDQRVKLYNMGLKVALLSLVCFAVFKIFFN